MFGTILVSNKLPFHLTDSFFTAIKSVDVVALENKQAYKEAYSKPNVFSGNNNGRGMFEDY